MTPTYSEMDNQNLLDQARAGDKDALGQLLNRCEPHLKLMAVYRLRVSSLQAKGDASGEVQDVHVIAFRAFDKFRGESIAEFEAWLQAILINELNHLYRDFHGTEMRDVTKEVSLDSGMPLLDPASSPSSCAGRNEEAIRLHEAISTLPEEERLIVIWHDLEAKSFTEIASLIGTSDRTASNRYLRALEKLGERLREPL